MWEIACSMQNNDFNISTYDNSAIDVFEGMISIRSVFAGIDSGANNRKINKVLFSENHIKGNGKLLGFLKARSFVYCYELQTVSDEEINKYAEGNSHGGVVMLCEKRIYGEKVSSPKPDGFYVLMEGIEDPYNLGYAIRSAYAAGADGILLPKRSPIVSAGIVARSSAGASEMADIVLYSDYNCISDLKDNGYRLVCADMDAPAPAHLSDLKKPLILAVGGEKRGFSKKLTDLSDLTVRLDYGRKFENALSAASAAAILSFEVTKQNPQI